MGRRRVEAAIAGLPDDFRMPLVLKEILGFSVADVAAILDLKPATVKTRLHRARLRVRKAMEDALPTEAVPPAAYSKQVCLDLLQAKQEALDHDRPLRVPRQRRLRALAPRSSRPSTWPATCAASWDEARCRTTCGVRCWRGSGRSDTEPPPAS